MNPRMQQSVIDVVVSVGESVLSWQEDFRARTILSVREMKTEADRRAHDLLHSGLTSLFQYVPVISEEDMIREDHRPDEYWIIDPIDGTASWYEGYSGFVCQAAFIQGEAPVFGVLHAPALKKTWYARLGYGAWLNGKLLPAISKNSERLILVDNYPEPRRASRTVANVLRVDEYIESGSLGLKCALVADGTADLFVKDVVVRDWDIAPAWVILHEVGACVCLPNGVAYEFSGSFEKTGGIVVARDSALAGRVVSLLQKRDTAQGGGSLFG
ncbi:MAG: inositol monophosphatase [Clostridia bacterium]|nr:inositol monophosphatase [Clostridia bacterium]